jgi:nucleotide-binding universal stress UspA family protein
MRRRMPKTEIPPLIAQTTHGCTGLARVVYGTVAEGILEEAACPVLLVRVTDRK